MSETGCLTAPSFAESVCCTCWDGPVASAFQEGTCAKGRGDSEGLGSRAGPLEGRVPVPSGHSRYWGRTQPTTGSCGPPDASQYGRETESGMAKNPPFCCLHSLWAGPHSQCSTQAAPHSAFLALCQYSWFFSIKIAWHGMPEQCEASFGTCYRARCL